MPAPAPAANAQLNKRPKDSDFYQQRLRAWQPILTPTWVIITFLAVGIPFIGIGIGLKTVSDGVVEYSIQYDGPGTDPARLAACGLPTGGGFKSCAVTFTTDKDMKKNVYVYYQLDNFYQNHRRYVKSRSDKQLAGENYDTASQVSSDCDPLTTAANGKVLSPCGLIANSYFNDSFSLAPIPGVNANMSESDISWKSDREKKFLAPKAWSPNVQYINDTYPALNNGGVTNEHFIVWMRVAALPSFRKLYGHIDADIPAGTTLTFNVQANYPVSSFDGKKYLVISTVSFLGGKNPFLGIAYIAVGALCVFLSLVFLVRQMFAPRKLGDTSLLVWKK